ncbi:MAG: 1-acyl-sn-glycerol-3-phosphate acyltransferase [Clostridiales bacterium]|nr:1-acyl-sn-glycerol-3-phosphate acyltransferase [Clostridiales bacterium]
MKNRFHMVLRFLLFPLARLLFPCRVMDKDKYTKYDRGQILISNHLSWMDVAYHIFWIPGYTRALSKKENEGGKLQHWFLKKIGILFVNRDKPELSSMRECINALKDGDAISIFPEGTRNRVNREIMHMHSGAAMFAIKAEAGVVPIAVHHKGKLFRRNYIGVGDRIDISDLYGKRTDERTLQEATDRFRAGIEKTLAKLDKYVEEKGWKKEKKIKRQNAKLLKKQYKIAKKQARKAGKNA